MYKTRRKINSTYIGRISMLNDLGAFVTQLGKLMNEKGKIIVFHTGKYGKNQKWKTLRIKK